MFGLQSPSTYVAQKENNLRVFQVMGQLNPFCSKRDPRLDPQLEWSVSCQPNRGANLWIGLDFPKSH